MFAGLAIIVGAAPKLQVGDRRLTTLRERDHMVELEKPAFIAAALCPDERALALIACPDLSLHRRRHVTTSRLRFVPVPGVVGARQLPLLNFPKQDRERPVEDFDGHNDSFRDDPANAVKRFQSSIADS